MNKSQDTKKWKAIITVDLTPINSYGDSLGGNAIAYTVYIDGSLLEIVGRLERLENP
jgi:hypothetical protein